MELAKLLIKISMIIFLLPPIRQYGGRFFFYFLILALNDPLADYLRYWSFPQLKIHIIFSIFLLISVIWSKKFIKIVLFSIPFIALYFYGMTFVNTSYIEVANTLRIIMGFMHIFIFITVSKMAIVELREKMGINLFLVVFLFYEATLILKFIVYGFGMSKGLLFFFMTLGFEILLAIFFICFRDDNPKLLIKINDKTLNY